MINVGKDNNAAYFHEDEYLMIELLPSSEYEKHKDILESEPKIIEDILSLSEDEINELEKPVRKLEHLKINKEVFSNSLENNIPVFEKVQTGYSSYYEYCNNTIALGSESYRAFIGFNNEGVVENIWIHNSVENEDQVIDAENLRNYLCSKFTFICLDWYAKMIFDFSNKASFYNYMYSSIKRIKDVRKRFDLG